MSEAKVPAIPVAPLMTRVRAALAESQPIAGGLLHFPEGLQREVDNSLAARCRAAAAQSRQQVAESGRPERL